MIIILGEKDKKELENNDLLSKGKVVAVVNREGIEVIKNRYGFKGKYTNNDLIRLIRDVVRNMKEKNI